MKTKLIALMLVIACLSACFTGCSHTCEAHVDADLDGICDNCEEEYTVPPCETHTDADQNQKCDVCGATIPAPCDPHKDENADMICDTCKKAIVTVVLEPAIETPERVEMVVNAIPEDVEIGQYIKIKNATVNGVSEATLLEGTILDSANRVLLIQEEKAGVVTYTIYNPFLQKIVFYVEEPEALPYGYATVSVDVQEAYFTVATTVYDEDDIVTSATKEYYTYDAKNFYTIAWSYDPMSGELYADYLRDHDFAITTDADYVYLKNEKDIYILDLKSSSLLHTCKKTEFVMRPSFDEVHGNYGYLEYNDTVFVYDLSKWISCVASYRVPSYLVNRGYDWEVLENGNVLIWGELYLSYYEISYDYVDEYGSKYDLVYFLMDVAKNETKEIEFGYVIDEIYDADTVALYYTDAALNVLRVYPIVKDCVDYGAPMTLVVDNTLQILYNSGSVLSVPDSENYLLSDNRFLKTEWLDNWTFVREIVNEKGEKVAYVPIDAEVYKSYILYDNTIHSLEMKALVDLDDYDGYHMTSTYLILIKYNDELGEMEYFYYVLGAAEETMVKLDGVVNFCGDHGFLLEKTVEDHGVMQIVYSAYNAYNKPIEGIEIAPDAVVNMFAIMELEPGCGVYAIGVYTNNMVYYLAK